MRSLVLRLRRDTAIKFLNKTVVEIATQTESTERKFIARWTKHFDENRYFRFNFDQGLQDIGLSEFIKKGAIEATSYTYRSHTEQKLRVRYCVGNLRLK